MALSARRLISVLYCMLVDWQAFTEEAEEQRQEIIAALEWPEVAALAQLEREDERNRRALAAYGFTLPG